MFKVTDQRHSLIRVITALLLILVLYPMIGQAHLIPAQKGTLNIVKDRVYMVLSIPVSAFPSLDMDNNGLVTQGELQQQQSNIISILQNAIHIGDNNAQPLDGILLEISSSHDTEKSDQLVVMGIAKLQNTPDTLAFSINLFGLENDEQHYEITATREDQATSSHAIVTSDTNHAVFFNSPSASVNPSLSLGIKYVLLRLDHVLFLITLLVLKLSARRWFILLTSFTVAHTATVTLASLSIVAIPATFTAPLIALIIIGLACTHLSGFTLTLKTETSIIFGSGLIHGLSFVVPLGHNTLDEFYPFWSILGFSLGIEIGQLLIAISMGFLLLLWKQSASKSKHRVMVTTSTLSSLLFGSVWFISRVTI